MKRVLFVFVLCCSMISQAQMSGSIKGHVLDLELNNEPLIFANVRLLHTGIHTQTNFHGNFEMSNIMPGDYYMEISYLGYEPSRIPVSVKEGERLEINGGLAAKRLDFPELIPDMVSGETSARGNIGDGIKR